MPQNLLNFSEQVLPVNLGDDDAWGPMLIDTHTLWDRQLGGVLNVALVDADVTLDTTQAQNGRLVATGAPAAVYTIFVPAKKRTFALRNAVTNGRLVQLAVVGAGGQAVAVPAGAAMLIYVDGVDCWALAPPVSAGGRIVSTAAGAPGLAFQADSTVGFRGLTGGIGLSLGKASGDSIRFDGANATDKPLITLADNPAGSTAYQCGLYAPDNDTIGFVSRQAERARINHVAFMINRQNTSPNVQGSYFLMSGSEAGRLRIDMNGGTCLLLQRYGTTGRIVSFRNSTDTEVGSIHHNGSTVQFNESSDARFKKQIEDFDDGLRIIRQMQVRSFVWKDDPEGQRHVGLIAQELAPLCPQAVSGDPDGEGPMQVDYSKLIPYLVAAIQELAMAIAGGRR